MRVRSVCAVLVVGMAGSASPAFGVSSGGDHERIVFDSLRAGGEEPDVWTMSAKGRNPVNLTPGSPAFDGLASWRPDGRKIVFISERATPGDPTPGDREVFVMNADGSNVTQITFNSLDDDRVAWAPDGRTLVVQRDYDPVRGQNDADLLTMKADGTRERNLTNSPGIDEIDPDWSPDGDRIAFASDRDGDFEISTMKPDGSRVRQITANTAWDNEPDWSPDGRRFAFTSDRDMIESTPFQSEIYTMRADGGEQTRRTFHDLSEFNASWSPDGRSIAFGTFRDATLGGGESNAEVYTMRADGTKLTNLTQNPAFDGFPDWQPLSDRHDHD